MSNPNPISKDGKTPVPKLTDIIHEDALRIFLEGFYRDTKLAVYLYADPDADPDVDPDKYAPIFNESDSDEYCKMKRKRDNPEGCFLRNARLAHEILSTGNISSLKKLKVCPFGMRHDATIIRHRATDTPVAILHFGGVATNEKRFKKELQKDGAKFIPAEDFEKKRNQFIRYATDIENYYNAHVTLMNYAKDKTFLTSYRSISQESPEFLNIVTDNVDKTCESILRPLQKWTSSALTALLIIDRQQRPGQPLKEYLVARHIIDLEELKSHIGKTPRLEVILDLGKSFVGTVISNREPYYDISIDPSKFLWEDTIRLLDTRKVLVLPLILPNNEQPLGCLLCFPRRDIWKSELPIYEAFARKTAVSIHLAHHNELYLSSSLFNKRLNEIVALSGHKFYSEMASLICEATKSEATTIFILDRIRKALIPVGSTLAFEAEESRLGIAKYKLGEGISGYVADQKDRGLYGEIVYDLERDHRLSTPFAERLPKPRRGEHTLMATQIPAPDGEIIGVIRCVDAKNASDAVFNCFNHYSLESLQYYASVFGIIYALKDKMRLNHESILRFVHEIRSNMSGIRANIELVQKQLNHSGHEEAIESLSDAVMISKHIMEPMLNDIWSASRTLTNRPPDKSQAEIGWWLLERDFLLPIRESFQADALKDRKIRIEFDSLSVQLNVDRVRIMQVFSNLVRNAIKYSYDPKNPKFKAEMRSNIRIHPYRDDSGRLCIDFVNQGIGIGEIEEEDIFELYHRGSNVAIQSASGLGYGLFVCRELMTQHGGDVFVKQHRSPTIMTIRFPSERVRDIM